MDHYYEFTQLADMSIVQPGLISETSPRVVLYKETTISEQVDIPAAQLAYFFVWTRHA